jgi:hypothetical protein
MAKTSAERQRDYRRRQAEEREARERAADARLRAEVLETFGSGMRELAAENEKLRAEVGKFTALCLAHAAAVDRCPECRRKRELAAQEPGRS